MAELLWWHRVGQKVVCVQKNWRYAHRFNCPSIDREYTVRDVVVRDRQVGFRLCGLINSYAMFADGCSEVAFCASGFRPVHETSIDCFRTLLTPTPDQVRELEREST